MVIFKYSNTSKECGVHGNEKINEVIQLSINLSAHDLWQILITSTYEMCIEKNSYA